MTIPIRKNTAQIITVGPFLDKTDGVSPELSLTVTGCHTTLVADTADGNAPTLVIDADATASGGDNDLVHITNDNAGYYSLELTAAQTNRKGHGRLCINDDDVHCPVFHDLVFLEANVFDSLYGSDKLNVDMVEISGDSTAADNLEDFYEETTAIGNLIDMFDGTGYAGGTTKLVTDAVLNATQGSYAPAKAGDAMDLVNAPNATAIAAIQSGLATPGDITTAHSTTDGKIDALNDISAADVNAQCDTALSDYGAAKPADIPSADITSILADTNELQAELADGGRTDLILDGIEAHVHATDGHVTADYGATEKAAIDLLDDADGGLGDVHTVANAIKAKTDNLPADPADESSLEAAITAAHSTTNGKIDAVDDYVDTEIAAIIGTLATIQGYVDDLESRLTAARAGYLDLLNTNLDAAISTRAAAATALSSATWTNTKAGYIDAAISSVGGGAAPTVEQIRAEMDSNSTKLALLSNGTYGLSALKTLVDAITGYVDDLETRLTATRAGYLDNLATAPPTAADIDTELSSSHGAGAWGAASTGSSTYTDTITDDDGDPLEDVQVELYSDSDYTTLVAVEETDVNGAFTFSLNPGVYYVRCVKSGYSFTDFSKTVT